MEIVILILSIFNFGLLIFLIFKSFSKKNSMVNDNHINKEQIEFNTEIKLLINKVLDELPRISKEVMNEEIIRLKNEFLNENKANRDNLSSFERIITEDLNKKFNELNETMNNRIKEIQERVKVSIEGGFEGTTKAYNELTKQLTLISEAKQNIDALSGEVVSLKNVLENNQSRGRYGEFALERIIYSIFGDAKNNTYAFQYNLKNYDENERPDAVIFLPEPNNLLCIDSKFPFAEYKNIIEGENETIKEEAKKGFLVSVKTHITDIAKKYIIKNMTADYALMFVPSDAIFSYIHAELPSAIEYARGKNVILTSPSTLQPILATLNLIRIQFERNKNIDKIISLISGLNNKFGTFHKSWDKLSERVRQLDDERSKIDNHVKHITDQFQKIENVQGFEIEEKE